MEAVDQRLTEPREWPGWLALLLATGLNALTAWELRRLFARIAAFEGTALLQSLAGMIWPMTLIYPLLVGAKALVFAGITWNTAVLLNREAPFTRMVKIFLWGEVILTLKGVASMVVYHLRGIDNVRSMADLQANWGIGLVSDPSTPWLTFLDVHLDIFDLLWFVYIVGALRALTNLSGRATAGLVGFLWLLTVLVTVVTGPQL